MSAIFASPAPGTRALAARRRCLNAAHRRGLCLLKGHCHPCNQGIPTANCAHRLKSRRGGQYLSSPLRATAPLAPREITTTSTPKLKGYSPAASTSGRSRTGLPKKASSSSSLGFTIKGRAPIPSFRAAPLVSKITFSQAGSESALRKRRGWKSPRQAP